MQQISQSKFEKVIKGQVIGYNSMLGNFECKIIYEIKGKPIHTPKIEENKTEIFIKEKGKFEELIDDQPLAQTTKEKTKSDKLKINNILARTTKESTKIVRPISPTFQEFDSKQRTRISDIIQKEIV